MKKHIAKLVKVQGFLLDAFHHFLHLFLKVSLDSPLRGYGLSVREGGDSETSVELTIRSVTTEDLGSHLVTLRNTLGSQTYRVRGH